MGEKMGKAADCCGEKLPGKIENLGKRMSAAGNANGALDTAQAFLANPNQVQVNQNHMPSIKTLFRALL